MKMAHLIMAYKDPTQIERLVKALSHEDFDFYIHLDKKIDIKDFKHLAEIENVYFIENRILVRWAAYSFTKAVVESAREILANGRNYDFINLLSGQDYPIKPVETIYEFYKKNIGYSFFSFEQNGSSWWEHAISRIEKYHTTNFEFKGQYRLQYLINLMLPKRKFPLPYVLYGGERCTWWTMSQEAAAYVIKFIDDNPSLRQFALFTWAPDEFLIATILLNSPLKNKIINNNLRHIDWSQGGVNPKILTFKDLHILKNSDKLFARKFDIKRDVKVLDSIDKEILLRSEYKTRINA